MSAIIKAHIRETKMEVDKGEEMSNKREKRWKRCNRLNGVKHSNSIV